MHSFVYLVGEIFLVAVVFIISLDITILKLFHLLRNNLMRGIVIQVIIVKEIYRYLWFLLLLTHFFELPHLNLCTESLTPNNGWDDLVRVARA